MLKSTDIVKFVVTNVKVAHNQTLVSNVKEQEDYMLQNVNVKLECSMMELILLTVELV